MCPTEQTPVRKRNVVLKEIHPDSGFLNTLLNPHDWAKIVGFST